MPAINPVPDPYRILGVPRGADASQIRAAHRRLAKRHHPDAQDGHTERFLAIQEAYQTLSDPVRRQEWDRRHAPGPTDARTRAPRAPAAPGASSAPSESSRRSSRQRPRRDDPAPDGEAAAASVSGRDPASRRHTWSAEGVPWWEDFTPKSSAEGRAKRATAPPRNDSDVYNRSSGAAWSMAARRHFRRGDADLPSTGVFRYRGTQVVTGAEARKVAAEEEAAIRAAQPMADPFRRRAAASPEPRQAIHHEPPHRASAAPTPAAPTHAAPTHAAPTPAAPTPRGAVAGMLAGVGAVIARVARRPSPQRPRPQARGSDKA